MSAVNTCVLLSAIFAGQVPVVEGDEGLVSREEGALLLRVDAERNDVAAVAARFSETFGELEGALVVFTTFEDTGPGGRAYSLPILNEAVGTGMELIDRREEYGVARFVQVINMKARGGPDLLDILAHELAHRHLAYVATSTVSILGRQDAHWHAGLQSEGSLMGGYGWRELSPGRFVVEAKLSAFSELDLYLLGLIDPSEVRPFFFIDALANEDGFALPESAELAIGELALGRRVDLSIEEIIAANGPRSREDQPMKAVFAVLTAPGESATSTRAQAKVAEVELLAEAIKDRWEELTVGRGSLCVGLEACAEEPPLPPIEEGCDCTATGSSASSPLVGLLLWALLGRVRK